MFCDGGRVRQVWARPPHSMEQLGSSERPPRVGRQEGEQIELFRCQSNGFTVDETFSSTEVDDERVVKRQHSGRAHRACSFTRERIAPDRGE